MTKHIEKQSDKFVKRMGLICFLGLGGFIAWAGFVPLEEGVSASGSVVVENNRQVVQHLEGGIIETIAVQEGDLVKVGDTLMVLQETASLAGRDQVSQQLAALRASVERLSALQTGKASLDFSQLQELQIAPEDYEKIVAREKDLFDQQRSALSADINLLITRRQSAQTTARLKQNEVEISERSLVATQSELDVVSSMFAQQLVRRDRLTDLERRLATQQGEIARLQSEKIGAEALDKDLQVQMAQIKAQFDEKVSSDLRASYAELLAAEESLSAAQDILNRSVIIAPVAGEVLNLAFSTRGGVVRPGEVILEIVPDTESVTASIRVRPIDRESIYKGQTVRAQVAAYKSWLSPSLEGEIVGVSADLKTDLASGVQYYEARIEIPPATLADHRDLEIIPGMPVDAFIFSGNSRTTFEYLFEPIGASILRGLRGS